MFKKKSYKYFFLHVYHGHIHGFVVNIVDMTTILGNFLDRNQKSFHKTITIIWTRKPENQIKYLNQNSTKLINSISNLLSLRISIVRQIQIQKYLKSSRVVIYGYS